MRNTDLDADDPQTGTIRVISTIEPRVRARERRCAPFRAESEPFIVTIRRAIAVFITARGWIANSNGSANASCDDPCDMLTSHDMKITSAHVGIKIGPTSIRAGLVVWIKVCRDKGRSC